jgi:hypothetical protein
MIKLERYFKPEILPEHKPHEIDELRESVKAHGQLRPIITYEGKILDGFKVYEFCLEFGMTPKLQEFTNTVISAFEYRISTAYGRALTQAQKACLATDLRDRLIKDRAEWIKKNKSSEFKKPGYFKAMGVKKGEGSRDLVSKQLKVSARAIGYADHIKKNDAYLFSQVKDGKMSLRSAYMKVKPNDQYEINRCKSQSKMRTENIDQRARKFMDEVNLKEFKIPDSIYASDFEIWQFDQLLKAKGYNLCLNRSGEMFDAVYVKHNQAMKAGYTSFKAAILSAGKAKLAEIMKEEVV